MQTLISPIKWGLWGVAALVMLVCLAPQPAGGTEPLPPEVVIGYQQVPNAETMVKELGWHEAALEIPVRWITFDSGRQVIAALEAGRIDLGLVGSSPCAAGIAQGLPLEVVWIHDIIGDNEALAVRTASAINTTADLSGKTIAAPFGSTTHYHLMLTLKLANIEASAVTLVNLQPREMLRAWQQGDIDAAFVWEPTLSKLLDTDGQMLVSSRALAERGFPTADLCVVRKDFATKYPDVVVKYLATLDRGVRQYRQDPQGAAAAVGKQLGIAPQRALAQMQRLILLTGEEQLSGKYVGDMQLTFGLYTLLKDTADFLVKAQEIDTSPPWPIFMRAVSATYVQRIITKKRPTLGGPRPVSP